MSSNGFQEFLLQSTGEYEALKMIQVQGINFGYKEAPQEEVLIMCYSLTYVRS